jgi:hypothetical protein
MAGSGEFAEVLGEAATEVTRQESRVDAKAAQLATMAGSLSTLAAGAVTGLAALAPRLSGRLVLAGAPLLVAAGLWAAALVVLLRRIIRPHLPGPVHRGSFMSADQAGELREIPLIEYRQNLVNRLGALVLARYRAVRLATDLLVAGFVPLLLAGAGAGVAALLAVVAR